MNIGAQLEKYLGSVDPFNWNSNNCCQFANGWLKFRGSPDYVAGFERVSTRMTAALVRDHGGLAGLITFLLDRPPAPVTQLQVGDLVMIPVGSERHSIGIHAGRTAAVLTSIGVVHDRGTMQYLGWNIK